MVISSIDGRERTRSPPYAPLTNIIRPKASRSSTVETSPPAPDSKADERLEDALAKERSQRLAGDAGDEHAEDLGTHVVAIARPVDARAGAAQALHELVGCAGIARRVAIVSTSRRDPRTSNRGAAGELV
jgi:hypothetical protein